MHHQKTTLGDISHKPQYGWTTRAVAAGKIKLLRTTDITSGVVNWAKVPYCADAPDDLQKYLLHPGDILISRAGSVGASFLIKDAPPEKAVFASYLIRFRPLPSVCAKFVHLYLQSPAYWRFIFTNATTSTLPNVNAQKLSRVPIPLPPLAEQRRIVKRLANRLATVAEMRVAAENQEEDIRKLPSAFLRQVFSRGKAAKGWTQAKLGDLCEKGRQLVNPQSAEAEALPYVGLEHIESQSGRILGWQENSNEIKSVALAFDKRHVLYGKLRPYLNKVALPDFAGRSSTELVPLLPRKQSDRFFLAWLLRHPAVAEFAMQHKTGSRMPRVNINLLLDFPIIIPASAAERRKIGSQLNAKMSTVAEAQAALDSQLEAIRALPAAYLREAFNRQ